MPGWTHPDFTATLRYRTSGQSYFENGGQVIVLRLAQALADCVNDLLRPFHDDAVDLVAGIDAMGFILGKTANKTLRTVVVSKGKQGVVLF